MGGDIIDTYFTSVRAEDIQHDLRKLHRLLQTCVNRLHNADLSHLRMDIRGRETTAFTVGQ